MNDTNKNKVRVINTSNGLETAIGDLISYNKNKKIRCILDLNANVIHFDHLLSLIERSIGDSNDNDNNDNDDRNTAVQEYHLILNQHQQHQDSHMNEVFRLYLVNQLNDLNASLNTMTISVNNLIDLINNLKFLIDFVKSLKFLFLIFRLQLNFNNTLSKLKEFELEFLSVLESFNNFKFNSNLLLNNLYNEVILNTLLDYDNLIKNFKKDFGNLNIALKNLKNFDFVLNFKLLPITYLNIFSNSIKKHYFNRHIKFIINNFNELLINHINFNKRVSDFNSNTNDDNVNDNLFKYDNQSHLNLALNSPLNHILNDDLNPSNFNNLNSFKPSINLINDNNHNDINADGDNEIYTVDNFNDIIIDINEFILNYNVNNDNDNDNDNNESLNTSPNQFQLNYLNSSYEIYEDLMNYIKLLDFNWEQKVKLSNLPLNLSSLKLNDQSIKLKEMNKEIQEINTKNIKNENDLNKLKKVLKTKLTFRNFKVGDLALFLPTKNSKFKPWAAFNISFPHYFLNPSQEQLALLKQREWIVARIVNIKQCIVDDQHSNPFMLNLGVKYFLLDVDIWQPHFKSRNKTNQQQHAQQNNNNNNNNNPHSFNRLSISSTNSTCSSKSQQRPPNLLPSPAPSIATTTTHKEDHNITNNNNNIHYNSNNVAGGGPVTSAAQALLRNLSSKSN